MRSAALVAALGAGLAAVPAAQAAVSVTVEKRCYAEGDTIGIEGAGFSPNGQVRLALERADGQELESTAEPVAEQDGTIDGGYKIDNETGWFTGQQTRFQMTLRLTDQTRQNAGQPTSSADVTATTSFIFSRWNVGVASPGGKIHPSRPARIKAFGYTNAVGKPLYAHWVKGTRRVFTKRIGRLRGPCGDVNGRLSRGFPFRPVAPGTYKVVFNSSRRNAKARDSISHTSARVTRRVP